MKQRRHSPEQVIRKLAEADKLLGQCRNIEEVCRHLEISESTFRRRQNQYGGLGAFNAAGARSVLAAGHVLLEHLDGNRATRSRPGARGGGRSGALRASKALRALTWTFSARSAGFEPTTF